MIAWKLWKKFDTGIQSMKVDALTGRFMKLDLHSQLLDITGLDWVCLRWHIYFRAPIQYKDGILPV